MKYKNILIIALITFLIDQISKIIITNIIELNNSINIINNFFNLTYTRNIGAAWSILSGKQLFLIIISIVALLFIFYLIKKEKLNKYKNIYYGLLIGGILGNLFDRIFYGYVIDFLDFKIFNYNYPIFNISDSCIVISVLLIIIETIRGGINEGNNS